MEPQYVLIIRKKGYLDALSVDVEAKPEVYDLGEEKLREVEKRHREPHPGHHRHRGQGALRAAQEHRALRGQGQARVRRPQALGPLPGNISAPPGLGRGVFCWEDVRDDVFMVPGSTATKRYLY